jgi:hypothetical protein
MQVAPQCPKVLKLELRQCVRCQTAALKVHKIENVFDSDFGICVISLLVIVSLRFFYRERSAASGYNWLPAPLGWKLADARSTKTVENNRNWAELLLHDVYFIRSKDPQIHNNHGCKTTISWF